MEENEGTLPIETIKGMSYERLNAFLLRKDAEHPCEACGAIQWMIDAYNGEVSYTFAPLVRNPQNGVIFLPVSCGNCFNTRFFNAARMVSAILEWERANG